MIFRGKGFRMYDTIGKGVLFVLQWPKAGGVVLILFDSKGVR